MSSINSISLRDYTNTQNINFGKKDSEKKSYKGLYLAAGAVALAGGAVFRKQIKNTKLVNGATKRINKMTEALAKKFPKAAKLYNDITKKVSDISGNIKKSFSNKFPKVYKWLADTKKTVIEKVDSFAERVSKSISSLFNKKTKTVTTSKVPFDEAEQALIEKNLKNRQYARTLNVLEKHGLTKEKADEFTNVIGNFNLSAPTGEKASRKEIFAELFSKNKTPKEIIKEIDVLIAYYKK